MKVLLDTNMLIDEHYDLARYQIAISSLSWAELDAGVASASDPAIRAVRQARLMRLKNLFGAGLPFDDTVATTYGMIVQLVVAQGRKPRARAVDLMIAATAVTHGAGIITRNVADFAGLEPLVKVIPA